HVREPDLRAALGQHRQVADFLDRIAALARVTHNDREALQAFDRFADVVAADRRRNYALHVGDVQAVARGRVAVDFDVDIAPAGQAFGERRGDAGHRLDNAFDFAGDAVYLGEVRARDLDADWAL